MQQLDRLEAREKIKLQQQFKYCYCKQEKKNTNNQLTKDKQIDIILIELKQQMSIVQLDRLSRQSQNKSQIISKMKNEIECLKSNLFIIYPKIDDLSTQRQLTTRIQSEKHQMKKEIASLKLTIEQLQYEQQNTQNRYLIVLQKLQQQVEQGKKKFNKLNNKIAPLMDHDTVRLSVMNQLSQQHQMDLEKYKHQIQQQKDMLHKLIREKTLLEHKLNTQKVQYEEKIRQLINSIKTQESQSQLTLMSLQMSKEIQMRLKGSYDTLKKQADYYKDKYFTTQKRYQEKVKMLENQLRDIEYMKGESK